MAQRILHIIQSDQRRGAEVFATQLARALGGHGLENALCVIDPSDNPSLDWDGLTAFRLNSPGINIPWDIPHPGKLLRLARVLRGFQPDVLLGHGAGSLKYGALSKAYHRSTLRVYRNIGMASDWVSGGLTLRAYRTMIRAFDMVVSLSPRVREDFLHVYAVAPDKVVTIPNGVDTGPYQELPDAEARRRLRHELGIEDNTPVLVNVGSLSPEKNQAQLLALMRDLRSKGIAARLLVVGDGVLRTYLKDLASSLALQESVSFLGSRSDVPAILGASDLFLLPSTTEAMPAAVIEAGLAGVPSVAYEVGALPDMIEHASTGLIAPRGNYTAFQDAVIQMLSDRSRREAMGAAARSEFLERYDVVVVADMYARLLTQTLKRPSEAQT